MHSPASSPDSSARFSSSKFQEQRPPSSRPSISGSGSRGGGCRKGLLEGRAGVLYFCRTRDLWGERQVTHQVCGTRRGYRTPSASTVLRVLGRSGTKEKFQAWSVCVCVCGGWVGLKSAGQTKTNSSACRTENQASRRNLGRIRVGARRATETGSEGQRG